MEINATNHQILLTRQKALVPTAKKVDKDGESLQENGQFPPPQPDNDTQSPSTSRSSKLPQVGRRGVKRARRVVGEIFPCKICLRPFNNRTSAHLHAHTHLNSDELERASIYHAQCPHCQKVFFARQGFKDHVAAHDGRKMHECPICKKKFTRKENLTGHGFVHLSGEEQAEVKQGWRHVCYFCTKRFESPSQLSRHLSRHTREKVGGRCHLCRKAFSSKQALTIHGFLHLSEDEKTAQGSSRVCLFCRKMFLNNPSYQSHLATHIPEKPFRCDQCGALFPRSSALKMHQGIHSSIPGSFPCDECDKAFARKLSLVVHKKSVHQKTKNFACPECSKKFGRKGDMVTHLNGVHLKVRHPCSHCGKTFGRKTTLGTHLKQVHPSACPRMRSNVPSTDDVTSLL